MGELQPHAGYGDFEGRTVLKGVTVILHHYLLEHFEAVCPIPGVYPSPRALRDQIVEASAFLDQE